MELAQLWIVLHITLIPWISYNLLVFWHNSSSAMETLQSFWKLTKLIKGTKIYIYISDLSFEWLIECCVSDCSSEINEIFPPKNHFIGEKESFVCTWSVGGPAETCLLHRTRRDLIPDTRTCNAYFSTSRVGGSYILLPSYNIPYLESGRPNHCMISSLTNEMQFYKIWIYFSHVSDRLCIPTDCRGESLGLWSANRITSSSSGTSVLV